jgi:hypothetical protein
MVKRLERNYELRTSTTKTKADSAKTTEVEIDLLP